MDENQQLSDPWKLKLVDELMAKTAGVVAKMGFSFQRADPQMEDKQVIYSNQIISEEGTIALAVHSLRKMENGQGETFNLSYHRFPGRRSSIYLSHAEVAQLEVQVAGSVSEKFTIANYKQFSVQVYLVRPRTYSAVDFIYHLRIDQMGTERKLTIGAPWISRETQIGTVEAMELVSQLDNLVRLSLAK